MAKGNPKGSKGKQVKSKIETRSKAKKAQGQNPFDNEEVLPEEEEKNLDLYDRIVNKVKRKRLAEKNSKAETNKGAKKKKTKDDNADESVVVTEAHFVEDDNYVDMGILSEQRKEFPTPSEEEQSSSSESEDEQTRSSNANSNANAVRSLSAPRSQSPRPTGSGLPARDENQPSSSRSGRIETSESLSQPQVNQAFSLMQHYMLKKGIIEAPIDDSELQELVKEVEDLNDRQVKISGTQKQNDRVPEHRSIIPEPVKRGKSTQQVQNRGECPPSPSDVTIYKKAVEIGRPPASCQLVDQVEKFIQNIRVSNEKQDPNRKISSSSDELMDTSDEREMLHEIIDNNNFVDQSRQADTVATRQPTVWSKVVEKPKEMTPGDQADEELKEAEKSRARLYELPGKNSDLFPNSDNVKCPAVDINSIDQDYQMIDAHIDDTIRGKIQNLKYVDFSRLISKNRVLREDEQRLEIISKDGQTFLSPVADRESIQINSYNKWEQAFRVFSNIVTAKYPSKASELLQYNHTIHQASISYVWDNVYAYDREFRQHISRHVTRPWNVILQQAWTMLLKDRVRSDNSFFQRGHFNGNGKNKGRKQICKRFNRGKCNFGLGCKFEHHCEVPKCSKFGHGAHICRLRNSSEQGASSNSPHCKDRETKN